MLYVFSGDDTSRIYQESRAVVTRALEGGAHLHEVKGARTVGEYEDLAAGDSLFGTTRVFVLEEALESTEGKEAFIETARMLATSQHLFVFRTGKLTKDKDVVQSIKTAEGKFWEIVLPEKRNQSGFNIFALADAFGERDKKKAWILLTEAFKEGVSAEEVHGTIFWMVKNMALVKQVGGAGDTGLSPFVLTKTTRFAGRFSGEELSAILDQLVTMYHDAHRGLSDLESDLERLVLTALAK